MQFTLMFSVLALAISLVSLWRVLPMTTQERKEYDFYLDEFKSKVGNTITWRQRLAAWNGAKGGPAPKWHWIKPVEWPFGK